LTLRCVKYSLEKAGWAIFPEISPRHDVGSHISASLSLTVESLSRTGRATASTYLHIS